MSAELINMKSFTGETEDSAAEGQQNVGQNSYIQETQSEDVQVNKEILQQTEAESQNKTITDKTEIPAPKVEEVKPSSQELNFKALREEIDRAKAEKDDLRANMELMRANLAQIQQSKEPEKHRLFEGMNKDDIPNVQDIENAWARRESEYLSRIEELQVAQSHTDYAEVLEKFTAPLLKQKPHLVEGIQNATNKALHAYELGKLYQQAQQGQPLQNQVQEIVKPTEPSKIAQKIVENARKPGSLSSAGGQGNLSKADYYASMSDAEFIQIATKNLGEI